MLARAHELIECRRGPESPIRCNAIDESLPPAAIRGFNIAAERVIFLRTLRNAS